MDPLLNWKKEKPVVAVLAQRISIIFAAHELFEFVIINEVRPEPVDSNIEGERLHIDIDIKVNNNILNLNVINKIVVTKVNEASSGIGIKNVQRRLDLIFKDNYTLLAKECDGNFIVKLTLKI